MRKRVGLAGGIAAAMLLLLVGLLVACAAGTGSAGGGSAAGGAAAAPAGGPPRIVVDNPVQDYGKVKFEQWVRPSFQIRNEGGSNLVISRTSIKTIEGC